MSQPVRAQGRAGRSRLGGCLGRLLIVALSTLLTLFLLDAGMRAAGRARIFSIEHRPDIPQVYRFGANQDRTEIVHGDERQPNDPIVQSWQVHWVTDAYGFRNSEVPAQIDTVLLADSFGSLPVTQTALLASQLGAGCGRSVYNLSISAHGPWQEYATLILEQDRLAPLLTPRTALIWMLYSGNDLDDLYLPTYGDAIKTQLTHQDAGPALFDFVTESPLLGLTIGIAQPHQTRLYDPKGRTLLYYEPYLKRAQRTAADIRAHPNYPLLRDTFAALAQDARQRQMTPLVVVIPSKEEVYYYGKASGFGAVVSDLANANHIPALDLAPDFLRRASQGEFLYLAQDTHWNEYAQQLVASQVCEWLADQAAP